MANELVSYTVHDCTGETTVDPSMGLPLNNAGVDAVSSANPIKELLGCRDKEKKNREIEGQGVEAVTSTRLCVFVLLHLLNSSQSRSSMRLASTGWGDLDNIHTTVVVTLPAV